ncbi:MAG: hypothetical protein ACK4F9_01375 [Brevinematia bacterium]
MAESVVSAYGIIKARFKAVASNVFGLIFVSFNLLSKTLEKVQVVSSHFSSIYENNPQMPWHDFEEKIINIKWKGEYSISITSDIQKAIDYELKSKERVDEIIYFITKNATPKIAEFLHGVLQRPTGDRNITIDLEIETISQEEVEEVNVKRMKKDFEKKSQVSQQQSSKQEEDEFSLPPNSIVLEASLVLSPITGIPVYELKPGDKVLTRITEKTQRGQYFKELLGAINPQTNEENPIPSTVEQIKVIGKNYVVLTTIGPGIYGKAIEEDNVKVKRYEGEIKGFRVSQEVASSLDQRDEGFFNILIFVGIAAGGLILVILILMMLGFF